ncbi:MAG: hypothetical protein AAF438_07075 [Pseudomonadota bacterium]
MQILNYVAIALGILLLIVGSYLAYLYITYIDQTVTSGSAYGFTVGQSKIEAYQIAYEKFQAEEIVRIQTVRSREVELKRHPWLREKFHRLEDVQEHFDQWNHWSVWLRALEPQLLAVIEWQGTAVSGVGKPGALGQLWQPEVGRASTEIAAGDSYEDAYSALHALAKVSGYEELVVRTGWMARRQPTYLTQEEFRFVEFYDEWRLYVGSAFNTIQLSFDGGKLQEIHRHRQHFELP